MTEDEKQVIKILKRCKKLDVPATITTLKLGEDNVVLENCKVIKVNSRKFIMDVNKEKTADFYFSFLAGKIYPVGKRSIVIKWEKFQTTQIDFSYNGRR